MKPTWHEPATFLRALERARGERNRAWGPLRVALPVAGSLFALLRVMAFVRPQPQLGPGTELAISLGTGFSLAYFPRLIAWWEPASVFITARGIVRTFFGNVQMWPWEAVERCSVQSLELAGGRFKALELRLKDGKVYVVGLGHKVGAGQIEEEIRAQVEAWSAWVARGCPQESLSPSPLLWGKAGRPLGLEWMAVTVPAPGPARTSTLPKRTLKFVMVYLTVGLLVGLWLFWPVLELDHRRLEPWKLFGILLGDIAALCWFMKFCVDQLFFKPADAEDGPGGPEEFGPRDWPFVVGFLISMTVDQAMTIYTMVEEGWAFDRAVVARGRALSVETKDYLKSTHYHLHCAFQDQHRRSHRADFLVFYDKPTGPFTRGLPADVEQALKVGRPGFPVDVIYDPSWPGRCWIRGPDWGAQVLRHGASLFIFILQVIGLPFFLLTAHWRRLYKVYPLMVEVGAFLSFGALQRFS